ncbi:hypothetical protein KAU11_00590 [Candidatus Babeliales bacterium]|nr:hypothetical protein [Candidatus Babeliales bacterium]
MNKQPQQFDPLKTALLLALGALALTAGFYVAVVIAVLGVFYLCFFMPLFIIRGIITFLFAPLVDRIVNEREQVRKIHKPMTTKE